MTCALDLAVGRRVRDHELRSLRQRRGPDLTRVDARIRDEGPPGEPVAQVGIEEEDAVSVLQRALCRGAAVPFACEALGVSARAACLRPYVAALIGHEHGLAGALEPGELVEHDTELTHLQQRQ